MEGGLLSLRWNDHGHTFFDMLSTIRRKEAYCDVTLVCDGRFYPVHKLVLSTCSDFFDHLFRRTDCKHPVVIVANVYHKDLEALLNYMYLGEVNVLQTELTSLMKAAEVLRIKGLAEPTKAPTKETRENKRGSSGEGIDSSAKRKRSEDIVSPSAERSSPLTVNKTAAKEPSRSRVGNDSQTSKNSDQVNASQSSSSCSSSATGNQREQLSTSKVLPNVSQSTHQEPLVSSQNSPTEQESGSKAVRPEVKVEEILIKDEPGSWFGESDEGLDNLQFSETDPTLDYNSQTAASYSGNCLPWELAAAGATQPHPVEGHFPQGMPGSSGMQGDWYAQGKKIITGRRKKLGEEERERLLTLSKENPKASSEKLRTLLLREFNIDISARTIRRELIDAGVKPSKPSANYYFQQILQYEGNDQNSGESSTPAENVEWNTSSNDG